MECYADGLHLLILKHKLACSYEFAGAKHIFRSLLGSASASEYVYIDHILFKKSACQFSEYAYIDHILFKESAGGFSEHAYLVQGAAMRI